MRGKLVWTGGRHYVLRLVNHMHMIAEALCLMDKQKVADTILKKYITLPPSVVLKVQFYYTNNNPAVA